MRRTSSNHRALRPIPFDFDSFVGGAESRALGRCFLADIGRAQIEARAGLGVDAYRVEELAVEDFDADDVPSARRKHLLHQCRVVAPKVEGAVFRRSRELRFVVELPDPRPASADVRLDQDGEAQSGSSLEGESRVVDDPRRRMAEAEPAENGELYRLRDLDGVGVFSVDRGHAELMEIRQVVERREDRMPAPAKKRRGAHAIHDERVPRRGFRIQAELARMNGVVGEAAPVQLAKQGAKPLGVLVKDPYRFH